jgi:hypothetical protein
VNSILDPLKPYLKIIEVATIAALAIWLGIKYHEAIQESYNKGKTETEASMNQKVIDAQTAAKVAEEKQRLAEAAVETSHAQLVENSRVLTAGITGSLRDIENTVRSGLLSGALGGPSHAGGSTGSAGNSSGNSELADAIGRFTSSVAQVAATCAKSNDNLDSILDLAQRNGALK